MNISSVRKKFSDIVRSEAFSGAVIVLLALAAAHLLFYIFTGKDFSSGSYNTYVIQAESWLSGRLDVDNRSWLELAVYEGRYYVSFPPFPSVLLTPLVFLFGEGADAFLAAASLAVGGVFTYKLCLKLGLHSSSSFLLTLLVFLGTNMWQISVDSWVWFLAQNLSFTLTVISLYCASCGRKGSAMFFLAAAVGCRPFQILAFPLVIYLLMNRDNDGSEKSAGGFVSRLLRLVFHRIYVYIPALILVIFYMWLNYARFGNVFEFGHNYLPEFTSSENGQFSLSYAAENFMTLFRLPEFSDGNIVFSMFNGSSIFIVIPLFVLYPALILAEYASSGKVKAPAFHLIAVSFTALQIFLLLCHKTMGGAHFGHRYIMDTVPMLIAASAVSFRNISSSHGKAERIIFALCVILLITGFAVNFCGTAEFYGTDIPFIALS